MGTQIKVINDSGFDLPFYATPGAAGMDLRAAVDAPVAIAPLGRAIIPTGLRVEIPSGYEMQIRPRSGLAAKRGITVLNTPGTIDSDYRGQICVILVNLSAEVFVVERGERIAQAVVARYETVEWVDAQNLDASLRGQGGFGSTGVM